MRPDARKLTRVVQQVVAAFAPERIVLFGSAARGTMKEDSDIDLLVVKAGAEENRLRWMQAIYRKLKHVGYSVDVLVHSQDEVDYCSQFDVSLLASACKEGVVLYESIDPRPDSQRMQV